jgi:lipopolysaccharide/colanic/teichoic acid biosynthesis glycosyltransferase
MTATPLRSSASAAQLAPTAITTPWNPTPHAFRERERGGRASGGSSADAGRRWINVVVAAVGLVLSSPLLLAIAILIKLTSRGPVLYTQMRVGKCRRENRIGAENHRRQVNFTGRPFRIYKFRTMSTSMAAADDQVWARPDDPRVTGIGRFLRKYRLDELPQLYNVLRGDMNIVGPRPEQPNIVLDLATRIDGYRERHRVLPGITGWAQVNHHYDLCVDDVQRKVDFDLEYIRRRSAAEDVRIMARTIPVMILKKGAW